jgi:transposase
MLGVVQTAEGLPLYHEVFDGNASETKTLLPTLTTVLARFPSVRRLILIADRGLLSLDNLESLQAIVLSSGQPLEFIIAVPGRRYTDFVDLLGDFHRSRCTSASAEIIDELTWNDLRLVVAHDPAMAAIQTQRRSERIDALIAQGEQWAGKLVEQDEGVKKRGRKLSDSGAKARFFHAASEAHLSKIIKVNLAEELFSYDIDANARELAEMMDGKLLLVTNVQGLTPADIVIRYKSLADIERGFKVLKSEIEIGPVYHRLPERIKAHASICFMALILHRVMRSRLRAANAGLTPERALEQLRRIQHHRIRLNGATPVAGVSSINDQQSEVLNALRVKKPDVSQQLTLL